MGVILHIYILVKEFNQLRPNSNFLKNLELKESILKSIKIYSFRTPFDLMIIPSSSSVWGNP